MRRIYVLAAFQGTGLGPALLDAAIGAARAAGSGRMLLGVHVDNLRARRFYERCGFAVIGQRTFQVGTATFDDPIYALDL